MPLDRTSDIPLNVQIATAPNNADGLNEYEEERLKRTTTHRRPHDLRAAFIAYKQRLAAMSDEDLYRECKQAIWLSAFANNNPRSDYHWQADLCGDESVRRGGTDSPIYDRAYKAVTREVR